MSNPSKILIFLNLLLISLVFSDLLLLDSKQNKEEFKSFHSSRKGFGRRSYEMMNFLECKSGNIYRLGELPEEIDFYEGQEIVVSQTSFLGKTKIIEGKYKNEFKSIYVSFISNIVLALLLLALLYTIFSMFYFNALIEFGLTLFSLLTYGIFAVYMYYF